MLSTTEMVIVAIILLVAGAIYYIRASSDFTGGKDAFDSHNTRICTIHYAPRCHYCKEMMKPQGAWTLLKQYVSKSRPDITLVENNEVDNPTPSIKGYPTIILSVKGVETRYSGGNDFAKLKKFVIS